MRIGYARVSTGDQSLDLQIDALKRAGCEHIFTDHGVSGISNDRPGLSQALQVLKEGDVLTVWRMDRMARSVQDLSSHLAMFNRRGIGLHSLCEYGIDTTTPMGRLTFHIIAAVAEFERAIIIERTRAGMLAAKERGAPIGRPRSLDPDARLEALRLIELGMSVPGAAQHLGVSKSTIYRAVEGEAKRAA